MEFSSPKIILYLYFFQKKIFLFQETEFIAWKTFIVQEGISLVWKVKKKHSGKISDIFSKKFFLYFKTLAPSLKYFYIFFQKLFFFYFRRERSMFEKQFLVFFQYFRTLAPSLRKIHNFFSKKYFSYISEGNIQIPRNKNFLCFSYIFRKGTF